MNLNYYILDDEDLEENIQKAYAHVEELKVKEEEKAEKQWESDILSGLHLNHNASSGAGSNKSNSKTPGSKVSGAGGGIKDFNKTPISNKSAQGTSFGSSIKNKKASQPMASKGATDIKRK